MKIEPIEGGEMSEAAAALSRLLAANRKAIAQGEAGEWDDMLESLDEVDRIFNEVVDAQPNPEDRAVRALALELKQIEDRAGELIRERLKHLDAALKQSRSGRRAQNAYGQ